MTTTFKPTVSIADLVCEPFKRGEAYESRDAGIADLLRLTQIGVAYSEVPPGKSGCPFHVHHFEDEMFVVLEGVGAYRFGDATFAVKAGDILGAPRGGPEYAHKLTNTGTGPLKYLSISSKSDTEICEYPDSGKFLVRSTRGGNAEAFRFIGRLDEGHDYWEGESGA